GPGHSPLVKVFDVDWFDEHQQVRISERNCKCKNGVCACGKTTCACSVSKCECSPKPLTKVALGGGNLKPIFQTASVLAYEPGFTGGVNVGTGVMDGQNGGFASILTGPASRHSPLVKTFVVGGEGHGGSPGLIEFASFQAYPPSFNTGVRVSSISTPVGADL